MMSLPPLVDTHCHLDYIETNPEMPDAEREAGVVLQRAMAEGLQFLVNPSVEPENFGKVIALAERFDNVYAAVAVHPNDVTALREQPDWLARIEHHLSHPKVVAVGETGLDYYRTGTEDQPFQQECFKQHLALAVTHDLPVIIHDREAHEDIHRLVCEQPRLKGKSVRGVMHCFSGDADFALKMVELGFYISFAGNVTFKNAQPLRDAAKVVPLEKLLIETDAPFLSPMPFRGKPNEPARVRYVAQTLADVKGISYEALAHATTENARALFGISCVLSS